MTEFSRKALEVMRNISRGKVLTYGEVAALAGNSRAARQVTRLLHTLSDKERLPWHRIVGKGGNVLLHGREGDLQRALLAEEGVEFEGDGTIDVNRFSAFAGMRGSL